MIDAVDPPAKPVGRSWKRAMNRRRKSSPAKQPGSWSTSQPPAAAPRTAGSGTGRGDDGRTAADGGLT